MTDEESKKAYRDYECYKRKRAFKAMFEKESFDCEFKELKYHKRAFYWIKAFICLLLNKTHGSYINSSIYMLAYDETSCIDCYTWQACWVERGIFKNWKICLSSDSN